jgi:glyoxylase-like metal-dependent hydrolase (beta-lactamase superfamily II)
VIFRQLFDLDSSTYTYLLGERPGGKALIIDPVREWTPAYLQLLDDLQLKLSIAIDTHTHADHVTALGALRDATGCVTMMGEQTQAECVSARFRDGETLRVGELNLRAIYTPGHTNESYSFYLDNRCLRCVFTGDVLLIRGTGRTDFQSGDPAASYDSIFNKLLTLPDDTLVYPGHDYKGWTVSTIGEERRCNPRLQVKSPEEYAAIMNDLKLPTPKLMDVAVPANLRCGREF